MARNHQQAYRLLLGLWLLASALVAFTIPRGTPRTNAEDSSSWNREHNKFCSDSYIHQSAAEYEVLDTGEIRARAQITIHLKAGDTVCLKAKLVKKSRNTTDEKRYSDGSGLARPTQNFRLNFRRFNTKVEQISNVSTDNIVGPAGDSMQAREKREKRSTLQEMQKQKTNPPKVGFDLNDGTDTRQESFLYFPKLTTVATTGSVGLSSGKYGAENIYDSSSPDEQLMLVQNNRFNILESYLTEEMSSLNLSDDKSEETTYPSSGSATSESREINSSEEIDDENEYFYIRITAHPILYHYAVLASYQFAEPALNITCTCACVAFHTCPPCGANCIDIVSSEPGVADCQDSLLGEANTCCQVQLRSGGAGSTTAAHRQSLHRFQAIQLSRPTALIGLTLATSRRQQTDAGPVHVRAQLGDAFSADLGETQVSGISGGRAPAPLQAGWYVVADDRLYHNPNINRHAEYSLQKLGWLKIDDGNLLLPSVERLRSAISVTTDSCTEQKFQIKEDILLDSVLPQLGEPVGNIGSMTVTSEQVTVEASGHMTRAAPIWVSLAVEHVQTLQPVFQQASLTDFDGVLIVNNRSQTEAHLQLRGATGLLRGTIKIEYPGVAVQSALYHFSWQAGVGSGGVTQVRSLLLPVVFAKGQTHAELCLLPSPSNQSWRCHVLPVRRQQKLPPAPDVLLNRHLSVNTRTNPTSKFERFVRSLNPANWLSSGSWSWTTALGAIVDGALILVAALIGWKLFSCFVSCFNGHKKS